MVSVELYTQQLTETRCVLIVCWLAECEYEYVCVCVCVCID